MLNDLGSQIISVSGQRAWDGFYAVAKLVAMSVGTMRLCSVAW